MLTAFLPLFCPLLHGVSSQRGLPVKGMVDWQLLTCEDAEAVAGNWPAARRPDNFWVNRDTMSFLVEYPQGIKTEAIVLENLVNGHRILLTAQTFHFRAADQVSDGAKGITSSFDLRRILLRPFSFKVLCLGQFLTSGPFAQDGLERLSPTVAADLLPAVAETLMCKQAGYAAVLIKDLYPNNSPEARAIQGSGFHLLPVDPAMHLSIPSHWKTADDYLADLTSKYRVRARRARTKMEGITRRHLLPEEIDQYQDRCFALYQQISQGADFNAASLSKAYFQWLARAGQAAPHFASLIATGSEGPSSLPLGAQKGIPRFTGYFNEAGKMIGFTTAIPNGTTYQAHFLGLEDAYNQRHHLYHNMLFDLLEDAIAGGYQLLDYGRTALEIKSSVGAKPIDYAVLVKARYNWLNRLIPIFTPAVYTAPSWTARNPFRQG